MTHPNIVFTPHQRIDQEILAVILGPFQPDIVSSFILILHLDASQLIYNASRPMIMALQQITAHQTIIL